MLVWIGTRFDKWFIRMCEYGFNENDDFIRVAQKCPTLGGTDFESVPKSTPVNNGGIRK